MRSMDFRLPVSGRIVAGGGHLHGGGVRLDLTNTTCSQRLFQSLPPLGSRAYLNLLNPGAAAEPGRRCIWAGVPACLRAALAQRR